MKEGLAKVGRETAYRTLSLYAGLDTIGAISKDLKERFKIAWKMVAGLDTESSKHSGTTTRLQFS